MNKKIDKFGIDRSHYKENILKKNELKDIINMYVKTKKINSTLINKYKQKSTNNLDSNNKKYLNKRVSQKAMTEKTLITTNSNQNKIEQKFSSENVTNSNQNKTEQKLSSENITNSNQNKIEQKLSSEKNLYQLTSKKNDCIYDNINLENEKKENSPNNRLLKRHYTFGEMKISKQLRRMGNKIIINEIKNLNKKTNKIKDQSEDKIYKYNIKLKYKKELITKKLLKSKINNDNDNKTPTDIIYKLLSDEPLFKQKMISDKICGVTSKMNDSKFLKHFSEDESIYHNFCLSAYNSKNMKIIEKNKIKLETDVKILRHISPCQNFGNKKLLDENISFNNYKNDYLNLRKTIGECKKYECEELLKKMNKKNKNYIINDDNINKMKIHKNKDAFIHKIKRQKILINAIMNPYENNSFPKYYLPKSGSDLLSKKEKQIIKNNNNNNNNKDKNT